MSKKRDAKLLKSYSPYSKGAWFPIVLFLALMLYMLYLMFDIYRDSAGSNKLNTYLASAIVILGILLVLYFVISNAYRSSLNFYEDGLELKRGNASLFCEWDNLSRIGEEANSDENRYGVFFHEKRKPAVTGVMDGLLFGRSSNFINLVPFTHVPTRSKGFLRGVAIELDKLRETEIGQRLFEHAPQLFREIEKPKR